MNANCIDIGLIESWLSSESAVSPILFSRFRKITVQALRTLPGWISELQPMLKGLGTPFADDLQATS